MAFVAGKPRREAERLGAADVHLWRMPYAQSQHRTPLVALLAAYLDVGEADVRLGEEARGKPFIEAPTATADLQFNWSHSGDVALVALTRRVAIGVDVERLGKRLRIIDLARRFFDPSEAAALEALAPDAAGAAFTGLWCAKEAVLKSTGDGLAFGLERIAFAHAGGAAWRLVRVDPVLDTVGDWQLAGFATATSYRGALAWRGAAKHVSAFALG